MQSLIRSKSAGVTGGRGTAGAGPGRDLLYNLAKPCTRILTASCKLPGMVSSMPMPSLHFFCITAIGV